MQTIGEREPLHGELGRFYDAIENPRKTRGELPILRDAELRAYLADVRERTLEVLDEVEIGPTPRTRCCAKASSTRCCSPTSSSTTRRCCSCCRWSTATSRVDADARRRAEPPADGPGDGRDRGRRVRDRRPAARLRLRQRAPPPHGRARRLRDRSNPGHQRRVHRSSWRRPAPSRRCTGSATARRLGADGDGPPRPGRPGPSRPPRLLARGRRLRPLGRQAAADRAGVGGGSRRGCDGRRPGLGMDLLRLPRLPRLRGVPLPRVLRGLLRRRATRCCAAAPGRPTPTSMRPSFRNWDLPQRRQIFSGIRCARDAMIAIEVHLDADAAATMARDVRAGLCAEPEGAGAEVLLRRARLAALRADHRAAPSTTRPGPSARSSPSARPRSSPPPARPGTLVELGSGSAAKTRHLLERDARCRLPARPTSRSTSPRRSPTQTAELLVEEYPGLEVRGLVCDFEHAPRAHPRRRRRPR